MKELTSLGLKSSAMGLWILDQTLLPQKEEWIHVRNPESMVVVIQKLQVRGAPLIGVAAALSLAHFALSNRSVEELRAAAEILRQARPTAVNLMNALDRMLVVIADGGDAEQMVAQAEALFLEDVELCRRIAKNGAALVQDGDAILTHCNTGGLATAGDGTALGVIKEAHRQGKKISVWVDETRPLLQGGRLTTWELQRANIPYTLITDSMAAMLMAQGRVQSVMVGSDRIAVNGDFANKIGTYSLAISAHYHRVSFYVAAPDTTIDRSCMTGQEIPIEQRAPQEVRGAQGSFGTVEWAPVHTQVYNPSFDVTPAHLVSRWILDSGVFDRADIEAGAFGKGH